MEIWTHPENYRGYSPDGDYVVTGQHRDSDALTRSNYTSMFKALREVEAEYAPPVDFEEQPRSSWVYDFRQSHSLVGWVETMLIRKDAPPEIIKRADEILNALEDYPVVDDDHFSNLEYEETCSLWESFSEEDRKYYLEKAGMDLVLASISTFPDDDTGRLGELLR
jgi:hypothetical protein